MRPGMDHYSPTGQPQKRRRTELRDISQLRDVANSCRTKGPDAGDSPNPDVQQSRKGGNVLASHRGSPPAPQPGSKSSSTKTKHDRKSNPSSRIHSLRRLLQRDSDALPRTVRQEKERELTALLLDQEKAKLKEAHKRNLKKYHMVRFFERRRAEKNLKRLIKIRDGQSSAAMGAADDAELVKKRKKLDEAIHEAEVDIAYTHFAPLGEKYISLFVEEEGSQRRAESKPQVKKQVYRMFSESEKHELHDLHNDAINVVRNAAGSKPPMWYEVEKCMEEGQAKLDALRDGKIRGAKVDKELAAVGGKHEAATRSSMKRKASFLEEDGHIDPADLDSEDDEMSDGDGGFFER